MAEVRSQSADDLVDGITSTEERRYSYSHYYGSRSVGNFSFSRKEIARLKWPSIVPIGDREKIITLTVISPKTVVSFVRPKSNTLGLNWRRPAVEFGNTLSTWPITLKLFAWNAVCKSFFLL